MILSIGGRTDTSPPKKLQHFPREVPLRVEAHPRRRVSMTENSIDERPFGQPSDRKLGRRAFLRNGAAVAGTAAMGGLLLSSPHDALATSHSGNLSHGDAAIL